MWFLTLCLERKGVSVKHMTFLFFQISLLNKGNKLTKRVQLNMCAVELDKKYFSPLTTCRFYVFMPFFSRNVFAWGMRKFLNQSKTEQNSWILIYKTLTMWILMWYFIFWHGWNQQWGVSLGVCAAHPLFSSFLSKLGRIVLFPCSHNGKHNSTSS